MPATSGLLMVLLKDSTQVVATELASIDFGGAEVGYVASFKGKLPGSTRSEDGTSTGVWVATPPITLVVVGDSSDDDEYWSL